MDLRKKRRVDYASIHDHGFEDVSVNLNERLHEKKDKWSTATLFRLEVLDERISDKGDEVLVHYVGWEDKYNEWRLKSEVVDVNEEKSDALELVKKDLLVKVKENLNISRVQDTEVTLHIPIQVETFNRFVEVINGHPVRLKRKDIFTADWASVATFLGTDWFFRVVNAAGDFAYVVESTIQIWIHERRCLEQYVVNVETKQLDKKLLHHGHLVFRCVKDRGDKFELGKVGVTL